MQEFASLFYVRALTTGNKPLLVTDKNEIEKNDACPRCGCTIFLPDEEKIGEICNKCGTIRCMECGNINFTYDAEKGEKVCSVCGIVHNHHVFEQKQRNHYENKENMEDHNPISSVFQTKKYSPIDFVGLSKHQKRALLMENHYDPEERQKISVNEQVVRLCTIFGFPEYIRETVLNHFLAMRHLNVLQGHRMIAIIATILFSTIRQYNIPMMLRSMVEKIDNSYMELTVKEVIHARNYFLKLNYNLPFRVTEPLDIARALITNLRLSKKFQESDLVNVEFEIFKILANVSKETFMKYDANIVSIIPALVLSAAKKMHTKITIEDISDCSYVSTATIKNKYKKIRPLLVRVGMQQLYGDLKSALNSTTKTEHLGKIFQHISKIYGNLEQQLTTRISPSALLPVMALYVSQKLQLPIIDCKILESVAHIDHAYLVNQYNRIHNHFDTSIPMLSRTGRFVAEKQCAPISRALRQA